MKYLIALAAVLLLTSCGEDVSQEEANWDYEAPSEEELTERWVDEVAPFPVTFPDGSVVNCVIYPGVAMECFE